MLTPKADCEDVLRLSHFTIEHTPDAVLWIDSSAIIRHVNQAACVLFKHPREELTGKPVYTFHLNEDEPTWKQRWGTIKANKTLLFEQLQPISDGQVIPVEVRANFIEFEGEEYVCTFLRDISAWKHARAELEESQRQLATLIHNLPGAVYRSKPDDKLTVEFITDWSRRITGYPPEDIIQNRQIAAIDLIVPDDQEKVLTHRRTCLQEHTSGRIMYRIRTAQGDEKWVADRFQGVYDDTGDAIAVEGFFNDITQQIQAEKDLAQALLEVEHLKNRLQEENIYLRQEIQLTYNFQHIISNNTGLKQMLAQVEQVAATDATVLILGETGTGKELIARSVHNLSPRKDRSLVKVNCAALPANLIESELFGHEKGAFTGALTQKIGRFELADKGTIFLDEIGELPLDLQVKLLRVLQEGEFERLGNPRTLHVDVRVIAATNRDLEQAVANGTFREDLYYRLNVVPIQVPPLRERKDDIPLLAKHFIQKYSKKVGKQIDTISQKVMQTLQEYHWPGNVRELENIIERAVILSQGARLELGDWFMAKDPDEDPSKFATLGEVERAHIRKVLEFTQWRVSGDNGAAMILGMHPQTLFSRMKKLDIKRPT